jgi:tryptophanyl-tRNA synthetase
MIDCVLIPLVQNTIMFVNKEKSISEFGISVISPELIQRFERITSKPAHIFIKRGFIFGHRDLLLNEYEAGNPIYIYTGRGVSL